jgi:uncharacterized iron-regulated membrane protein
MIRRIIFWTHLCCGVAAAVFIFTMSLTGVLLTYERQIKAWDAGQHHVQAAGQPRLPLEQLISLQQQAQPDLQANALVVSNDPAAPVSFRAGRQAGPHLNPYTGAAMEAGSPRMSAVFAWITGFHRWFNMEGEQRAIARQVTGISNVIFLFLVLSGIYLWLPRLYKWTVFKARLMFSADYPNSKTRDFHWHHIFGIWAAVPLLAVVYTGAVISYPWAANLMYRAFGAEVPAVAAAGGPGLAVAGIRPANPQPGLAAAHDLPGAAETGEASSYLTLDRLLNTALAHQPVDWQRVTLTLPKVTDSTVMVEVDAGNGAQAQLRHTLTLDRSSGEVLVLRGFADMPAAQRLRTTARFLHTGEVLGFWGQTLAGLASLAALFLVWTGLALSWRRLVQPLFRK